MGSHEVGPGYLPLPNATSLSLLNPEPGLWPLQLPSPTTQPSPSRPVWFQCQAFVLCLKCLASLICPHLGRLPWLRGIPSSIPSMGLLSQTRRVLTQTLASFLPGTCWSSETWR